MPIPIVLTYIDQAVPARERLHKTITHTSHQFASRQDGSGDLGVGAPVVDLNEPIDIVDPLTGLSTSTDPSDLSGELSSIWGGKHQATVHSNRWNLWSDMKSWWSPGWAVKRGASPSAAGFDIWGPPSSSANVKHKEDDLWSDLFSWWQ